MDMPEFGRTDAELASLPLGLAADSLVGKVVLISGAGSGIGRGVAHWCARLGAKLILCGRRLEKIEVTAQALTAYGTEVMVEAMSIASGGPIVEIAVNSPHVRLSLAAAVAYIGRRYKRDDAPFGAN